MLSGCGAGGSAATPANALGSRPTGKRDILEIVRMKKLQSCRVGTSVQVILLRPAFSSINLVPCVSKQELI
jgi:hypothetical protein